MKVAKNKILPKGVVIILFVLLLLLGFYIGKKYKQSTSFVKNAKTAEEIALKAFEKKWENVSDGCGINCPGCGVKGFSKNALGYTVSIAYECGMKLYDENNHKIIELTVSSDGRVKGLEDLTPEPGSNEIQIQETEEINTY